MSKMFRTWMEKQKRTTDKEVYFHMLNLFLNNVIILN